MSPLYSLHTQDSELKDAIQKTTDPLFLSLLKEKCLQLSRRICAEMSKVSLARDKQYRSFHNTNSAPIRCGLASPTAPAEMEKATPYWDKEAKKAGTKRNRLLVAFQEKLFFSPGKELLDQLEQLGSFKECLKALKLELLLELPESLRKQKAKAVEAIIKETLKNRNNIPFC